MSLDKITQDYINQYKLKGITPEWLTLLTKTVNSRNISTVDWNIAMDDIRKVASDSVATYNFIKAFREDFRDYYNRSIKSIKYVTDDKYKIKLSSASGDLLYKDPDNLILKSKSIEYFNIDTVDALKDSTSEDVFFECGESRDSSVGFVIELNTPTYIDCIQLYFKHVVSDVEIRVSVAPETTASVPTYEMSDSLVIPAFSANNSDTYIMYINKEVKYIWVYQPKGQINNLATWTNGRFGIRAVELFKANTVGKYVLTRYDGRTVSIPMVNPDEFDNVMQNHLNNAERFANEADTYANNAHESELRASDYEYQAAQHRDSADFSKGAAEAARDEALEAASDANTYLEELKDVIADSTDETNTANKLLRLDSTGKIPTQFIPTEKTIEMFRIYSEADLTTLSKAQLGDIAYIVNENGDADANYRLIDDNYNDRKNWILQTTSYVSQAAVADRAVEAENTTKVNGVLVRIGNYDSYKKADTEGLYIITDYSESES